MKKSILLFIVNIICCGVLHSQSIEDIIKLHENNMKELYTKRGMPDNWLRDGNVDVAALTDAIQKYQNNVAILIYTHKGDTLSVNLINKSGNAKSLKVFINKYSIIKQVDDVNALFSSNISSDIANARGSIPTDLTGHKKNLEDSFLNLNSILLPSSFNLEAYDHIIIVPIFNLSTLPFAAFKIGNEYLIDKMSYSIAPSLFEIMVSVKINEDDFQIGNKSNYNWTNALFVADPEDSFSGLPDLPGAIDEVNYITKSFPKNSFKILAGTDATKTAINENLCDYDLLYFATHGVSNTENPLELSYLVLSGNKKEDSFFTTKEIMNTRYKCKLKADLVVLSACQTGLGKAEEGGIIGLARSFQIAGANRAYEFMEHK